MSSSPLLLCTDFDGTLFDHDAAPALGPAFFQWVEKEREKRPVQWIINTGRGWESLKETLEHPEIPFWPDWVVLIEREVSRIDGNAIVGLETWNKRCMDQHAELYARADSLFVQMRRSLESVDGITLVDDIGCPFGLVADDLQVADALMDKLMMFLESVPELKVVRNHVWFRFAHQDFHKGSCLATIAQEEGLKPENCFAIGDHYNDLPMLRKEVAGYVGCPSNAVPAVQEQVRAEGGFVATQRTHAGVLETLEHYFA